MVTELVTHVMRLLWKQESIEEVRVLNGTAIARYRLGEAGMGEL